MVGETVAGFLPSAREWGVRLELASGEPVPVDADPERLAQIVANLVENALKYATGTVQVGVERRNGRVELHVDDDGPGVPVSEREPCSNGLHGTRRAQPEGRHRDRAGDRPRARGAMGGTAACQPLDAGGTRFVVAIPA